MSDGRFILVVEDDPDVREALLESLEEAGFAARGAEDGLAALAILRACPEPAVIFLDLMMPRMNGMQFREVQRGDPQLRALPVVLLSADAQIEEKAHLLGAAGFLKKPVSLERLLSLAAQYVEGLG